MPIAVLPAIIGGIAAAASIGGTIASSVGGSKEPQRSPQGQLLFNDAARQLADMKPPTPLAAENQDNFGPRPLGTLGGGLTMPQGGLLARANALQDKLGNLQRPQGTIFGNIMPSQEDIYKKKPMGF